jgi:hypothetical protein
VRNSDLSCFLGSQGISCLTCWIQSEFWNVRSLATPVLQTLRVLHRAVTLVSGKWQCSRHCSCDVMNQSHITATCNSAKCRPFEHEREWKSGDILRRADHSSKTVLPCVSYGWSQKPWKRPYIPVGNDRKMKEWMSERYYICCEEMADTLAYRLWSFVKYITNTWSKCDVIESLAEIYNSLLS